ncbi:MAG: DUF1800 family protein [Pedosphaera sp.]|nr:DUF1800 family protein [Pedosphaera sp.]
MKPKENFPQRLDVSLLVKRILPLGLLCLTWLAVSADEFTDPAAPTLTLTNVSSAQKRITFTPFPSADVFTMLSVTNLGGAWATNGGGAFSNLTWTGSAGASNTFYRLQVTPLASNALLTATALNRLGYGPTPDLLDRLLQNSGTNSAAAWITEQLAPETITERAVLAHTNIAYIQGRFGTPSNALVSSSAVTTGIGTTATSDLQSWLVLDGVFADRQLLEVLTQFIENHLVTYAGKSANFFIGIGFRDATPNRAPCEFEWREVSRWRNVLLNPTGTFYDLLKISAESPAMLIYLDTYASKGSAGNTPNENYSRELMELFTMGVDNGYDQSDITNMAPAWTGWTVELVNETNWNNPFAAKTTIKINGASGAYTNLYGVWTLNYKSNNHANSAKTIYGGKYVPARFGAPYTNKLYGANVTPGLYQLTIPSRTGTNGMTDGYDIIAHLADLPFTQEYLSVKLCRLFVHDNFSTGYDYTDPNLGAEGQLVKACMAAWEGSSPKGQLRPVLATIFNSSLFRSHGGNAQKVKTPLEFCVSAVRALRQSTNGTGLHGSWASYTDGYGLTLSSGGAQTAGKASPLMRIGSMNLFNRDAPDGYPEAATSWVDAGGLVERARFISSLLKATGQTGKNDDNSFLNNNITLPVKLLQIRLPNAADQTNATKVADTFLPLLFPGEGRASLDAYRTVAVNSLNTDDTGTNSSPFASLTVSSTGGSTYDTRVRGMLTTLMSLQRFQEQ